MALLAFSTPTSRIYRGRTFSEWLDAAAYQDVSWWPGRESTDEAVRGTVFWALAMIHAEREMLMPVLMSGLQDNYINVRHWATNGLGEFGPDAKQATPTLTQFLEDINEALKSDLTLWSAG